MGIDVLSTGSYVPPYIMTNTMLEEKVDTNDAWIFARTGIKNRHFVEGEDTTEIACKASEAAIKNGQIDRKKIGLVIVATFTPDHLTPSVACMVQSRLGLRTEMMALDINAACSGFVYGLKLCDSLLATMRKDEYALLIGAEVISKVLDFTDRGTCILFGDGAAAVVLQSNFQKPSVYAMESEGNDTELYCPGSSVHKLPMAIKMDGQAVFRFAVTVVPKAINTVLKESKLPIDSIDYFVCHQANSRIIDKVRRKLGVPEEKFYMNMMEYGNTSAASIPLVLDEMHTKGLLEKGMKIILVGFGGGFTWGATLIEW